MAFNVFLLNPDPAGACMLIPKLTKFEDVESMVKTLKTKSFVTPRVLFAYVNSCRRLKRSTGVEAIWNLSQASGILMDEILLNSFVSAAIESKNQQLVTKLMHIWPTVASKERINTYIMFAKGFITLKQSRCAYEAYKTLTQACDTKPTPIVFSLLIEACRKCRDTELLKTVYYDMKKLGVLSEMHINSILAGIDSVSVGKELLATWSSISKLSQISNTCIQFIQFFQAKSLTNEAVAAYKVFLTHENPTAAVLGALSYACRYTDQAQYIKLIWDDTNKFQVVPHATMLNLLLTACTGTVSLSLGMQIHQYIIAVVSLAIPPFFIVTFDKLLSWLSL